MYNIFNINEFQKIVKTFWLVISLWKISIMYNMYAPYAIHLRNRKRASLVRLWCDNTRGECWENRREAWMVLLSLNTTKLWSLKNNTVKNNEVLVVKLQRKFLKCWGENPCETQTNLVIFLCCWLWHETLNRRFRGVAQFYFF